jgi:SSS family solute:Na+ symporter
MVQKFYAIKSEDAINKGTVISTLFAIIIAGGCYFLGGFGRIFNVDVANEGFDAIIPTMLSGLSDVIVAMAVVLVLSASMSTLASLVLTSSSTLTLDFIVPLFLKNKKDDKKNMLIIRIFIAVFIVISAVIAINQHKNANSFIAQLMGLSWGALAGAFLAPFLYSLYWKRVTKPACIASFISGTGIMLSNMFFKDAFPEILKSPINCGAFAMVVGLIIVPVVSLITKAPKEEHLEKTFACYEETVTVPITEALNVVKKAKKK